ncbi:AMP-binding enzyme [Actinomadura geliboluensis]
MEVENVLAGHPGVVEAAVVGVPIRMEAKRASPGKAPISPSRR